MTDLMHFVGAQARMIDRVRRELKAGRKESHWMWFVFPQIKGLGHSATAHRYAIDDLQTARAYLAHPVLGPRLIEAVRLALAIKGKTAEEIFGYPDVLKFRSSLTLFTHASEETVFREALQHFYGGEEDAETLKRL